MNTDHNGSRSTSRRWLPPLVEPITDPAELARYVQRCAVEAMAMGENAGVDAYAELADIICRVTGDRLPVLLAALDLVGIHDDGEGSFEAASDHAHTTHVLACMARNRLDESHRPPPMTPERIARHLARTITMGDDGRREHDHTDEIIEAARRMLPGVHAEMTAWGAEMPVSVGDADDVLLDMLYTQPVPTEPPLPADIFVDPFGEAMPN